VRTQVFFKHDGAPIRDLGYLGEVLAQKLRTIGPEVPASLLRPAHQVTAANMAQNL
jgi:hypothetical protein